MQSVKKNINGTFEAFDFQKYPYSLIWAKQTDDSYFPSFKIERPEPSEVTVFELVYLTKTTYPLEFEKEPDSELQLYELNIDSEFISFSGIIFGTWLNPEKLFAYRLVCGQTEMLIGCFKYNTNVIEPIGNKLIELTKSPLKFYNLDSQISSIPENTTPLLVNYKQFISFRLLFAEGHEATISNFYLKKLAPYSLDVVELIDIPLIISQKGQLITYQQATFSNFFFDPGRYQLVIEDSFGAFLYSEIFAPAYPNPLLFLKHTGAEIFNCWYEGNELNLFVELKNPHTCLKLEGYYNGNWYLITDCEKCYSTQNQIAYNNDLIYTQIRYTNYLLNYTIATAICSVGEITEVVVSFDDTNVVAFDDFENVVKY